MSGSKYDIYYVILKVKNTPLILEPPSWSAQLWSLVGLALRIFTTMRSLMFCAFNDRQKWQVLKVGRWGEGLIQKWPNLGWSFPIQKLVVLERAHFCSNLSFVELHNFEFEHTMNSSFIHFSSLSLSWKRVTSFCPNFSSFSSFIEFKFV